MNKGQLIESVAATADLPKTVAGKAVEAVLEAITDTLRNRGEVAVVGFGTFSVKERSERTGRNPKTGEPLVIPASLVPSFKAGKVLKDCVNKGPVEA